MSGTSSLMLKPDFMDIDKLSQIVMHIEDGIIIAIISENRKGKPKVVPMGSGSGQKMKTIYCLTLVWL
ncbi:MAG: hypothetical protein KAW56_10325 [Candidatus Marinimicrobia bacterium]|nr:hypothetical protein [Candidatus Neomarinimicrobiota bacterium]